jgi:3-hydroxyisobutyrate dehydrogenase-like beta-hydroxyacid dehydrogenase
MKLGFIGVGKMGSGMARNLLRAGHEVTLYNRTRRRAEALVTDGARIADLPAEAARDAEAVFTILSDDDAVEEVVFGENGIAAGLREGAAHISSSTISVAFGRRLNQEHKKREQAFVAANVFGRPEAAERKQLIVVTAGDRAVVERLRPLMDAIGRKTFVAGDEPWQANAIKLCGNFMIASMLEAFAEALATMRKAQIDVHAFVDIMAELFGSPVYKNYGQIMADERFEPAGFALKLGLKDARLAIEAAQDFDVALPFASVVRDHFISALAHGQEELDWSSIARVLARNAALPEAEPKVARPAAG